MSELYPALSMCLQTRRAGLSGVFEDHMAERFSWLQLARLGSAEQIRKPIAILEQRHIFGIVQIKLRNRIRMRFFNDYEAGVRRQYGVEPSLSWVLIAPPPEWIRSVDIDIVVKVGQNPHSGESAHALIVLTTDIGHGNGCAFPDIWP